jgi:hypothetical protein|tara:strand:- start:981 stop:1493 length:513 start_codon:yes stop_codon:yes gene_type:complete
MAKKKKKKEVSDFLWFPNYVPGLVLTNSDVTFPHKGRWTYSYSITRPGPPMSWFDSRAKGASEAFYDYTFSGPVELMGVKSGTQAGLLTRAGLYATFRGGLAIEIGMDFAIVGAVLTVADPADKWEGGLDEWGFLGGNQQASLPGTMSSEEGTSFMWGLKQGHLGFLFGS